MSNKITKGGPRTILIIIGSVLIFASALAAGIAETNKGDANCNCISRSDRGWRGFSAVAISLGIPFFILVMIFGFSCGLSDDYFDQAGVQGWLDAGWKL